MLPSLCYFQVRRKTHYRLQLQDARRRKESKRAAISAARHENKPTKKSALMSRAYAAGCVGCILPHPPKGEQQIIPQVQMGVVQKKAGQVYILFLIALNPVLLSSVNIQHMKLERGILLRRQSIRETIQYQIPVCM